MPRATFDPDRDVAAYGRRADGYERGFRGFVHAEIARRVGVLSLSTRPRAGRVLDVGCGSGALLRFVGTLLPSAALDGVDPASEMVHAARAAGGRAEIREAGAEDLPFPDGAFDLVVSSSSYSHWRDQERGLRECRRVLAAGGALVLADVFTDRALPVRVFGPGGAERSRTHAEAALQAAGFTKPAWRPVFATVISAAVADR